MAWQLTDQLVHRSLVLLAKRTECKLAIHPCELNHNVTLLCRQCGIVSDEPSSLAACFCNCSLSRATFAFITHKEPQGELKQQLQSTSNGCCSCSQQHKDAEATISSRHMLQIQSAANASCSCSQEPMGVAEWLTSELVAWCPVP
jgi:hypothetical protein